MTAVSARTSSSTAVRSSATACASRTTSRSTPGSRSKTTSCSAPARVLTNDRFPRAHGFEWEITPTLVQRGATVGANATIVCGVTLGAWSMIGAGAVVTARRRTERAGCRQPGAPLRLGLLVRRGRRAHDRRAGRQRLQTLRRRVRQNPLAKTRAERPHVVQDLHAVVQRAHLRVGAGIAVVDRHFNDARALARREHDELGREEVRAALQLGKQRLR